MKQNSEERDKMRRRLQEKAKGKRKIKEGRK
jgi:hypothetical protein